MELNCLLSVLSIDTHSPTSVSAASVPCRHPDGSISLARGLEGIATADISATILVRVSNRHTYVAMHAHASASCRPAGVHKGREFWRRSPFGRSSALCLQELILHLHARRPPLTFPDKRRRRRVRSLDCECRLPGARSRPRYQPIEVVAHPGDVTTYVRTYVSCKYLVCTPTAPCSLHT